MKAKIWPFFFLTALILYGCSSGAADSVVVDDSAQHSHGDTTHTHPDEADGGSSVAVTTWSEDLELFMEHPVLTVGRPAKFAVHLTKLADFRPVALGPVLFQFTTEGANPKIVTVGDPDVPGIFGPSVTFDQAGRYSMRVEILSDEIEAGLEYGPIEVWASDAGVPGVAVSASAENISYLKEQQWKLPFASQEVRVSTIHETLRVPAEVRARVGSESIVTSVVAGRYQPPQGGMPRIGTRIEKGRMLGVIQLLPVDRSGLMDRQLTASVSLSRLVADAAQARARIAAERSRLDVAKKKLLRVRSLVEAEALPAKRLLEAESEVEIREAALSAEEESLEAHQGAISRHQSTEDNLEAIGDLVSLVAPISGYLVGSEAIPGEFVDQGDMLFHIVDLSRVWIAGRVFEKDVARLEDLAGGTLDLPGLAHLELSPSQLVQVGAIVDKNTRTLPVIFEIDNPGNRIKLGSHGKLHLKAGGQVTGPVVPASAVLLEENQSVVYVQLEGEIFERRLVETGAHDTEQVQITKGLQPGERIVTLGAYNVALAARSTEVPDHGHVH